MNINKPTDRPKGYVTSSTRSVSKKFRSTSYRTEGFLNISEIILAVIDRACIFKLNSRIKTVFVSIFPWKFLCHPKYIKRDSCVKALVDSALLHLEKILRLTFHNMDAF